MKRILLLFFAIISITSSGTAQSFTVRDLVTLADLPSQNISRFMHRNGFELSSTKQDSVTTGARFIEKIKAAQISFSPKRSVDIYLKDEARYFVLSTSDYSDYTAGLQCLIKEGFLYDKEKDPFKESSMVYQKANITVLATVEVVEGISRYTFNLKERSIPSSVVYAEDLLRFDSHEFLVSFFGQQNVSKDMYYLSEKELKKCSVLFSGTPRQVVFIWGDQNRLSDLSYIIVTNALPTVNARMNSPLGANNEWQFKNGIHAGMSVKDLLKINQTDFDIYGKNSELAFMAKPDDGGKIDFKKTAVMLSCDECTDKKLFDQNFVSALDVCKANMPLQVTDVILYPDKQ